MPFMKGDNSPSIRGEDLEKLIIGLPSKNEQTRVIKKITSVIHLIWCLIWKQSSFVH